MKPNKGFTLLEVMVTVAIFAIIVAAIFTVLGTGRNTWLAASAYTQAQQETRKAKEWLTKEVLQARNSTVQMPGSYVIGNTVHSSGLIFQIPIAVADGGGVTWQTIEYSLGGTGNKQLIKTSNGNTKVIANDVTAVDFHRELDKPQLIYADITIAVRDVKGRMISSILNLEIKFRN